MSSLKKNRLFRVLEPLQQCIYLHSYLLSDYSVVRSIWVIGDFRLPSFVLQENRGHRSVFGKQHYRTVKKPRGVRSHVTNAKGQKLKKNVSANLWKGF